MRFIQKIVNFGKTIKMGILSSLANLVARKIDDTIPSQDVSAMIVDTESWEKVKLCIGQESLKESVIITAENSTKRVDPDDGSIFIPTQEIRID